MMKKIVVPTDFSPDAEKAYALAGQIASNANGEIILLHIISSHLDFINNMSFGTYAPNMVFDQDPTAEIENAKVKLEELVKSDVFKGAKVTYFISESYRSNPLKDVLDFLNKHEHSLIVMGTSGDDFGGDTNAELVARKAIIPVLTVRDKIEDVNIRKILVPTDFHTVDVKFMHRVATLANVFGALVEYVYINTPKHFKDTDYIEKEWRRFKKKYDLDSNSFSVFNDHDVELGIVKMVERSNASLLALPTHGRTGFGHLFRGSYTEDIINDIAIPVYSYNMSNDYHPHTYSTVVETRGFTG
jgi:nucleotide-binding universal stress UspA family protein